MAQPEFTSQKGTALLFGTRISLDPSGDIVAMAFAWLRNCVTGFAVPMTDGTVVHCRKELVTIAGPHRRTDPAFLNSQWTKDELAGGDVKYDNGIILRCAGDFFFRWERSAL